MRTALLGVIASAACFGSAASSSAAQTGGGQILYVYDEWRQLSTVDLSILSATAIGTLPFDLAGLAAQPGTGRLFAVGYYDNVLFEIDPSAATLTTIGPLGQAVAGSTVYALEFTRDGRLIGHNWFGLFPASLFQIDLATGHATTLAFTTYPSAGGLAQVRDGTVYAAVRDEVSGQCYMDAYDPMSWALVSRVAIPFQLYIRSLEADCDGTLYAVGGFGQKVLYRVDLPSMSVHHLGVIAGITNNISGIAFTVPATSAPETYCLAKVNSLGCQPAIGSSGAPSATATWGFVVTCSNVRNNKAGLLFYGVSGQQSVPYQGGTLCVKSAIRRTPAVSSSGNPLPANDCSGVYQIDMSSFAQGLLGGNPLAALQVPGTGVDCQWWGRDPGFAAPNNTTLSNGLRYFVCQ